MSPHDVIVITAESHPALFAAFELISHDSGRQAGHVNYAIPLDYTVILPEIELQLATLKADADSDFECLCIGDEAESQQVVHDYRLQAVDRLLQAFFEEFQ